MKRRKGKRRLGTYSQTTSHSKLTCGMIAANAETAARALAQAAEACDEMGNDACNKVIVKGFPFDRSLDEVPGQIRQWAREVDKRCQ